MHVFITGASGFIGKAVLKELLSAGHTVLGLARTDKAANELVTLGATVKRGSLHDLNALKEGAAASDGVIHLAFIHDFPNYAKCCEIDRSAIQAIGDVLAGSNRPFLITSGSALLSPGKLGFEKDAYDPSTSFAVRGLSETLGQDLALKGIRTVIMRLPAVNHGDGDVQFIPILVNTAREKGISVYIGDGQNRWPAVHGLDTAIAYRLALEKAPAGSTVHPVAEEGVKLKDIAEVIGKKLGVPVESRSMEGAQEIFGWFTSVVGTDNPLSSEETKKVLGWEPKERTLLADLEEGRYFET